MSKATPKSKEVLINGKVFHIRKWPAVAGRSIVVQYPLTAIVQNKEYDRNEEIMLKLMSFIDIQLGPDEFLPLSTVALIDNHVGDWQNLVRLEKEAIMFNCPFLTEQFMTNIYKSMGQKATEFLVGMFTDAVNKMKESI